MSRLVVCAVWDNAVKAFSRPFFVPAKGAAMRSFIDECSNVNSEIYKHPSDYSLFLLGEFDEQTGYFESFKTPEVLLQAREFVTVPLPVGGASASSPDV